MLDNTPPYDPSQFRLLNILFRRPKKRNENCFSVLVYIWYVCVANEKRIWSILSESLPIDIHPNIMRMADWYIQSYKYGRMQQQRTQKYLKTSYNNKISQTFPYFNVPEVKNKRFCDFLFGFCGLLWYL